ncbi:universal stress protein [Leucothrix sargassi]|nr:universal stress protein [Leucothrix sargassi]
MTIKDIHVHVDNDSACGKRLNVAAHLSEKIDAHLTGIFVNRSFPLPSYEMFPATDDIYDSYEKMLEQKAAAARDTFFQFIDKNNARVSWKSVRGSFYQALANEARYSDLLILGQPDPSDTDSLNKVLADEIIFTSGRPCLLVPHSSSNAEFGTSPLIAWDGSREASRAIHDALPLLELAGKATIYIVDPEKTDTNFSDLPGAMMSEHLARHGIDVTVQVSRGSSQSSGDAILNHVETFGHDLIVMGAYGHSRWREIVLGGATRTIIKDTNVPVFMSH